MSYSNELQRTKVTQTTDMVNEERETLPENSGTT